MSDGAELARGVALQATDDASQSALELPDLMKAADAVDALSAHFGGSKCAKDLLVDSLRDGKVRAYALRTWTVENMTALQAWRDGAPRDAAYKEQIDAKILRGALHLHTDKERWDWNKGDFYIRRRRKRRTMFKNTRFAYQDVAKLLPTKSRRGRPRDENSREEIWLAILRVFDTDGLEKFKSHSAAVKAVGLALQAGDAWAMRNVDYKGDTISKMVTLVRQHFNIDRGSLQIAHRDDQSI